MNIGELVVTLGVDASQLVSGVNSAVKEIKSYENAVDSIVKKINRDLEDFGRKMKDFGRTMSIVFTAPIILVGKAMYEIAGKYEQIEVAFNVLTKSVSEAKYLLQDLEQFAKRTPFKFKDLIENSKFLMAMGFQAKEIIPTMEALGNAVSALGGGSDLIHRVILALGQMRAKARISAQEMRQLAEAGIPAWEILQQNLYETTGIFYRMPELMDMAEKKTLDVATAFPALIAGMQQRFGGMMAAQMTTLLGQVILMKNKMYFIVRDLGMSLLPLAKKILSDYLFPIIERLKKLVDWFVKLDDAQKLHYLKWVAILTVVGPVSLVLGYIATNVLPGLVRMLGFATKQFIGLGVAMLAVPGLNVAIGIGLLATALFGMYRRAFKATDAQKDLNDALEETNRILDKSSLEQFMKGLGSDTKQFAQEIATGLYPIDYLENMVKLLDEQILNVKRRMATPYTAKQLGYEEGDTEAAFAVETFENMKDDYIPILNAYETALTAVRAELKRIEGLKQVSFGKFTPDQQKI